jgi:hypothetical protein
MIALGETHQKMLELTKPRVEKVLNLPVHVVDSYDDFPDAADPFEIKLQLLSTYRRPTLFIDTDVVLFGWRWDLIDPRAPNFALNVMSPAWPGTRAIQSILNGAPCVNTGVWYAPLHCDELFHRALKIKRTELKDFPYALGDQTPLNVALSRAHKIEFWSGWKELPSRFNVQLPPSKVDRAPKVGDLAIHLVGGTIPTPSEPSDLQSKLRRVRDYCEKYPLP